MKKVLLLFTICFTTIIYSQNISFTFVNARNTNDGVDDYYEADIYIASDADFKVGSGQIYFNYNTEAFGENVKANNRFEMTSPDGSILSEVYFFPAYSSFIVNDNTASRVSTSFQQAISSGTITANNVTSTPKHIYSVKFKYVDISKDPMVEFEDDESAVDMARDQFFTACGPTTGPSLADCTNNPGTQIQDADFDSSGAVIITSAIWSGVTSSDWDTTSNWDISAVPETTYDITIPNVTTAPVIDSGDVVQMDDLTVESGASFTANGSGAVFVDGDFLNTGTVTMNSSSSESSAFIVTGNSTGTVTYNRAGLVANQWSIISSPVAGQSIKEFVENVSNDIRVNTSVTPNRYAVGYYDDSNADGSKWVYFTTDDLPDNSLTFEEGRSYAISRGTSGSVSFTGTLETQSVTKAVTASEWNAVGNPFTAFLPINGNSGDNFIADNSASMDDSYVAVYIWDDAQAKYVANSLVDADTSLTPGQGFFIFTATDATDVTFDQAQRTEQPIVIVSKGVKTTPHIELLATSGSTTVTTDIKYYENATKGLDPGYDIGNFGGSGFDVFTHLVEASEGTDFTFQSLPNSGYDAMIIPVGLKLSSGKSIELRANIANLSDVEVYLEDKQENKFTNLSSGESYTITSTENIDGIGRFYLHTQSKSLSVSTLGFSGVNMYGKNSEVIIEGLQGEDYGFELYDILGKSIYKRNINGSVKDIVEIPQVHTGIFIVKLTTTQGNISKKIILNNN